MFKFLANGPDILIHHIIIWAHHALFPQNECMQPMLGRPKFHASDEFFMFFCHLITGSTKCSIGLKIFIRHVVSGYPRRTLLHSLSMTFWQTATMKLLSSVFSYLHSRRKTFAFPVNSWRHFSFLVWFIQRLDEKNTNSEIIFATFATCHKRHALTLNSCSFDTRDTQELIYLRNISRQVPEGGREGFPCEKGGSTRHLD